MIEVTCGACGTTHRFAESDVPPGGRTTTCPACKAKLVVPGSPPAAGNTGDVIDLAELPAPKRPSPLAGAGPAKPAPKSPLSGAAPTTKPAPPSALDLGDINLGLDLVPPGDAPTIDLPAPVGPTPTKGGTASTPIKLPPLGAPTTPKIPPIGPMTKQGLGPGIRPGAPGPIAPAIPKPPGVTDLPAPKRAAAPARPEPAAGPPGITDLPAPKRTATGIADLPAPKRTATPARGVPAAGPPGITDLPTPKRDAGGGGIDLPAPKGFFDDLPAPVGPAATPTSTELAPKGFFDDLPGDALAPKDSVDLPAPKGFFDDLPGDRTATAKPTSDVAPKGFFDDLPGDRTTTATPTSTELAPKGFFDDIPKPVGATPTPDTLDLAPKGFFDDIPVPPATIKGETLRPGKPLDLDDLELAPHSQVGLLPTAPTLDLEPMPPPEPPPLVAPPLARPPKAKTTPPPGRNVPALELPETGDPYGGLDLPPATAVPKPVVAAPAPPAASSVVSFKPSAKADDPIVISAPPASAGALDLDIESAAARTRPSTSAKPAIARRDKDDQPAKATAEPRAGMAPRTKTIALAALLGFAAAGAGGFFYYKHWKKTKHRGEQLGSTLAIARSELASGKPKHWDRASSAAESAVAIDPANSDALALAAEAAYAGLLDEGTDAKRRTDLGTAHAQRLITSAAAGPDVDKAIALKLLVDGGADRAADRLKAVIQHAPNDADALLFLGWADLGAHAWKDAIADFDRALKAAPARDVPALYGRAQAKLALGDRDGARSDFDAVLAKEHDHVGAQVGQAAAAAASDFEQRDSQLAALLARKDLDHADPRAIALAWTLWADDARLAGRLDAAGDRYKHALDLDPQDQAALIGQADLAIRAGHADAAKDLVDRALRRDDHDVDANLIAAQLELGKKQPALALARLDKLAQQQQPITAAAQLAKLTLLRGNALEAQGKLDDALAAYQQAAAAAGDSDVTPTIAAAQLLAARAAAADQAKNAAEASKFRQQAEDLLAPLAAKAQTDPAMAVTLGVAYLQSGAPDKAEPFLQAAVTARPKDVEALFQLATAQAKQGKKAASLATRQKAFDADPSRLDVGGALAKDYEDAGEDAKAGAIYDALVKDPNVTTDVRARAGRFWARTGAAAKAGAQGELLLESDPDNAAGLYLQAEGLLADGKIDPARRTFQKASDYDPQPEYFDGLGRADEALWNQTQDTRFQEDALRAYARATDLDPKMFHPLIGRGRLMLERNDFARALDPLNAARAIKPDDPEVAFSLGVALHGANRDREAIAWLIKANQLQPRAEGYKLLGEIYANNDQAAPAADAFAHAVAMAVAQEKQTGNPVEWLTDVLYEQFLVANTRNDLAGVKRAGQMFLDRNPKDGNKVNEVQHVLLGIH